MDNVMIFAQGNSSPFLDVTTARRATIENGLIVLQGAIQTRVLPNGTVQTLTIAARDITVPLPLGDSGEKFLSQAYNDPYAMDSKRLSDQIAFRKLTGTGGSDLAGLEITLAQKYALPFASFIAVLIALPLAVRFGKKGRTLGIALSVVVLFVLLHPRRRRRGVRQERRAHAVDRRVAAQRHRGRRRRLLDPQRRPVVRGFLAISVAIALIATTVLPAQAADPSVATTAGQRRALQLLGHAVLGAAQNRRPSRGTGGLTHARRRRGRRLSDALARAVVDPGQRRAAPDHAGRPGSARSAAAAEHDAPSDAAAAAEPLALALGERRPDLPHARDAAAAVALADPASDRRPDPRRRARDGDADRRPRTGRDARPERLRDPRRQTHRQPHRGPAVRSRRPRQHHL